MLHSAFSWSSWDWRCILWVTGVILKLIQWYLNNVHPIFCDKVRIFKDRLWLYDKKYYVSVHIKLNVCVVYISNDCHIFSLFWFWAMLAIFSQCILNNWSTISLVHVIWNEVLKCVQFSRLQINTDKTEVFAKF